VSTLRCHDLQAIPTRAALGPAVAIVTQPGAGMIAIGDGVQRHLRIALDALDVP
jgi:hypothetical protein